MISVIILGKGTKNSHNALTESIDILLTLKLGSMTLQEEKNRNQMNLQSFYFDYRLND